LRHYDFEFSHWPVDFQTPESSGISGKELTQNRRRVGIKGIPCELIAYIMAHTIGRRMLFPGSVALLQNAVDPMLQQGRTSLVEEHRGRRNKLLTSDGNEIDTMFVDRRVDSQLGETLVICCEGNAGFYEIGIMSTPLECQYSILGWNHPGFGGSSGIPFPDQEKAAMDVVLQFAIYKLGFPLENIVLYAWSIGGYTASWAAMNYPDIRALILDATFDDLLPLAIAKMPASWKPLVISTVKRYMNLNIVENVIRFNGPIVLFRRTRDEVITTDDSGTLLTNRGNVLLMKLLQHRFPHLITEKSKEVLLQWLIAENRKRMLIMAEHQIEDDFCQSVIISCMQDSKLTYPCTIGEDMNESSRMQLVLFLADKYMRDFDASHCIPLPANMFTMPWEPKL